MLATTLARIGGDRDVHFRPWGADMARRAVVSGRTSLFQVGRSWSYIVIISQGYLV